MPHATRTVTIAAPVEKVFAFFTDPTNETAWRSGVKEMRAGGPPAVGTVVRQTVAGPMGRGVAADIEITDYRPHEAYGFTGISGPVRPVGSYTFASSDAGTDVTFRLDCDLSGIKGRVLSKQVQRSMDGEMAALDTAKRLLEG